jgi:2-keto-3-deoxy-L-rhamnonate aldolase RhmA
MPSRRAPTRTGSSTRSSAKGDRQMADARARYLTRSCFGTFIYSHHSELAEAAGLAGCTFLAVDMEASSISAGELVTILQAAQGVGCEVIVRVPYLQNQLIAHALDVGANGILVPKIDDLADAIAVIDAARYPPDGCRGVNALRASRYGTDPEYQSSARLTELVLVQAESLSAIASVDDIAALDGLDGIFIGPGDLSLSSGLTEQDNSTELAKLRGRVVDACEINGKLSGIFAPSVDAALHHVDEGFNLIAIQNNVTMYLEALRGVLNAVRLRSA